MFNIPNMLSVLRIILIPVFLYLISLGSRNALIWGVVVFSIASFTDLLDGWSARRLKQETDVGRFLDPLADKFLVISAFVAFLFLDPLIPFWMVIVVVARDLLITVMRYLAMKKGTTLRTSRFGKVKTAFQMVSIIMILTVFYFRHSGVFMLHRHDYNGALRPAEVLTTLTSTDPHRYLIVGPYLLMLIVTVLTALSGLRYLFTNWKTLMPPYKKIEGGGAD